MSTTIADNSVLSQPVARQMEPIAAGTTHRAKAVQLVRVACVMGDQAVVSATNFATTLIIGRHCLPEDLGRYALGMSVVFGLMNIPRSIVWAQHTNRRPRLRADQVAAYTGSALVQTLVVTLALTAVVAAGGCALQWSAPESSLGRLFLTLAPVCGAMMMREHARQISLAGLRLREVLTLDVALAVLQVGGLMLLAQAGSLTVGRAYLVVGGACVLSFSGWQLLARRRAVIRLRLVRLHTLQDWRLAKWVLVGSIVLALGEQLYPWLLAYFDTSASVGVMFACASVIALANPLLVSVANYSGPTIAHAYAARGIDGLWRALSLTTLAVLGVVLAFIAIILVWGAEIIEMLYGSQYRGNRHVLVALALPLLTRAALIPLGCGLLALERGDLVFRGSLVFLVCTLSVGAACVYSWGPAGVGYGTLIAGMCVIVVQGTAFMSQVRDNSERGETPGSGSRTS